MDELGAVRPDSLPPRSIRVGLLLVLVGVWLAAVDLVADTVITLRLLTRSLHAEKFGELWAFATARVVVGAAAIAVAVVLVQRIRRRRQNLARNWLIGLLCVCAVANIPIFLVTAMELLTAALGGDYGKPLETWVNFAALGSMFVDVLLALLAVTSAILLAVGRGWTRNVTAG